MISGGDILGIIIVVNFIFGLGVITGAKYYHDQLQKSKDKGNYEKENKKSSS